MGNNSINAKSVNQGFHNYSIKELKQSKLISGLAYNMCCRRDLNSLNDICEFYKKYRSFERMRGCGRKTNNDLISLVYEYFPEVEISIRDEKEHPDSIESLRARGEISDHTYYTLRIHEEFDQHLRNLKEIIAYYKKNWSFDDLRGLGDKSRGELMTLMKNNNVELPDVPHIILTAKQSKYTLDDLMTLEELPVRAYNILKSAGINTFIELLTYYYKNRTFVSLQNMGQKSEWELLEIINKYKQYSKGYKENDLEYDTLIQRIHSRTDLQITDFITDFRTRFDNKTIPLFKLIGIMLANGNYLKNRYKLDKAETEIIKNINTAKPLSTGELAECTGTTKEEVEEKKKEISNELFHACRYLLSIIRLAWEYAEKDDIIIKDNRLIADTFLTDKLNARNDTSFNHDFMVKVLRICNPGCKIISKPVDLSIKK